jgi:hypothetical protein
MTEWQPIETAPKDNTVLLLCSMEYPENPFIDVGYWETYAWWSGPKEEPCWVWSLLEGKPTHWMSLPEPPK